MNKISLINLGCVRNLVDAQGILGRLQDKGFEIVPLDEAETVIINTCGFIKDAKQESIDAILEAVEWKRERKIQKLIVSGCLSQRYANELKQEFPEVDAFVGVPELLTDTVVRQVPLTSQHMAYLKICESCFNYCAFCVIPRIKGKFASRSRESLWREVAQMDERGVKELNIIGQDTTAYGLDLYGEKSLAGLLQDMARRVESIRWIRFLYTYPAHITDELLDVIAGEPKICRYIDVPFQHVNDEILSAMNRNFTGDQSRALVEKIRKRVPEVRIRSAFITGLPGEGEKEFAQLKDFIQWGRFDRVGIFAYSPEEGTSAFSMPGQVPERVGQERRDALMQIQQDISRELNENMIGQDMEVMIEDYDEEQQMYSGRTEFDAPDVDGVMYVESRRPLGSGQFIRTVVTDAYEYDLVGKIL